MGRRPKPLNLNPRPAAFDAAVIAAIPTITRFAQKLTRNATRAEDLVQDVLARAFAYHDTFEMGTNIVAWLLFMMKNRFYDQLKAAKYQAEDPDGIHAGRMAQPPAQENAVELIYVQRRLDALHPQSREALLMAFDGASLLEIAEAQGSNENTIKSRLHRARAAVSKDAGVWA